MTATLEPLAADEVYSSALEPRPRGAAGRVAAAVLDLWCAANGGLLELTRAADIVVRRRADDVEELRIPVPVADDAAMLIDLVRDQLESLSPEEFRSSWSMD